MRERPKLEPGQEWVWDYPRPPRLERVERLVRVVAGGVEIARSQRALRVLETSHPPVYYLPPEDVRMDVLRPGSGSSFCEWKGSASYYDLVVDKMRVAKVAWSYAKPSAPYEALAGYLAFYPGKVDACYVGDERVQPQPGDFYGGWITSEIVGPFKGAAGTSFW
jgi:uncharacterized protein (DUF427 family)